MPSLFTNVLSDEELQYLNTLPEVLAAKANLRASGIVRFTIPVTDTIRSALQTIGLDLSTATQIPMRWIQGDTAPHVDSGATDFEKTFLVYLNDSPGQFVLDSTSYPITANTAFVFNEGLSHLTQDTGSTPRLLLGPMNELAEPVGVPTGIYYYNNYADAYAGVLAEPPSIGYSADSILITISGISAWRIAAWSGGGPPPSGIFTTGTDLNSFGSYTYYVYPANPCFKEGTQILCQMEGKDVYRPIETLTTGTLVKTSRDGYKKVVLVGKGSLQNPGTNERLENRLYKCSPEHYPELTEDLFITGCHSILVDSLTENQRQETVKHLGKVFVTDGKYRLMACIDERATPFNSEGVHTIYHLALEHEDGNMNYGVYANGGLLVETCCLNSLRSRSNMTFSAP